MTETRGAYNIEPESEKIAQLVALQVSDIAILNDQVQQLSRTLKEGHPSVRGTRAVARDILSGLIYRLGVIQTRMPKLEQALGLEPEKPYTCCECGKALQFSETFFLDGVTQGLTYCQEHLPIYSKDAEGW